MIGVEGVAVRNCVVYLLDYHSMDGMRWDCNDMLKDH